MLRTQREGGRAKKGEKGQGASGLLSGMPTKWNFNGNVRDDLGLGRGTKDLDDLNKLICDDKGEEGGGSEGK